MRSRTIILVLLILMSGVGSTAQEDERVIKTANVKGRIVYEDTGNPLRRVFIKLVRPEHDYMEDGWVMTDDEGRFNFKAVEFGKYFVHVDQAGIFNPDPKKDATNPNFQKLIVDSKESQEVEIAVKRGGAIEGRVSYPDGLSAIGVRVDIESKDSGFSSSARTDDRGIYRFSALRQNEYIIYVSEPLNNSGNEEKRNHHYGSSFSVGYFINVYYPNVLVKSDSTSVFVHYGQEVSQINIPLPVYEFGSVAGQVVSEESNTPIKGVEVSFLRLGDNLMRDMTFPQITSVATDENGKFQIRELPEGKYRLSFDAQPIDEDGRVSTLGKKFASRKLEVEISKNEEKILEVSISKAARVKGNVVFRVPEDSKKTYLSGILFLESDKKSDSEFFGKALKENGSDLEVWPFELTDLESGDNYSFDVRGFDGAWIQSVKVGGKEVEKLNLSKGEEIEDVEIALSTVVGKLEITKKEGLPLSDIVIIVGENDKPFLILPGFSATADESALVWNTSIKPGMYRILYYREKDIPISKWLKDGISDELESAVKVKILAGEKSSVTLN